MFGLFRRVFKQAPLPMFGPEGWLGEVVADTNRLVDQHATRAQKERRHQWFQDRMWHNGAHATCCPKCLQAGYVMALLRANRLDLLVEYPELISVYEELQKDGMIPSRY